MIFTHTHERGLGGGGGENGGGDQWIQTIGKEREKIHAEITICWIFDILNSNPSFLVPRCLVAGLASGSILAIAVNFPGRLWPEFHFPPKKNRNNKKQDV